MINNILDNIEAVIFDLDGTLVDSMGIWKQIDIEHFAMYGKELPDDLQTQIEGMSFYQTAVYIKETYDFPETIEEMMELWNTMAYKKYSEEIDFKNGAFEFLKLCKNKGIKLGVATSNSRYLFDAVSNHLGISSYFDCVLTGSEITNGKPAPDVYLKVAERLNVSTDKCLVFEDIIPGIQAGHNAGMKVCTIYDDYSKKDCEKGHISISLYWWTFYIF